ncbi:hypothetical protein B7494_g3956 [Chlorociboria aeruginascens]|nr:hypothetical protein B7494_g3956 [Chlorociboria aeruginascens]
MMPSNSEIYSLPERTLAEEGQENQQPEEQQPLTESDEEAPHPTRHHALTKSTRHTPTIQETIDKEQLQLHPETDVSIADREERAIAALLTRFKNLVDLAAAPPDDGATKEVAAAQAFQMEVESGALVRAAEDLLQLTRELKEMWLFGPLRGIGDGEGEGSMTEDSKKVGELVNSLLQKAVSGEDINGKSPSS